MCEKFLIIIPMALLTFSCQPKNEWDVRDYGAVADSTTVNTEAIQSAIDACSGAGGGTVIIEGGTYVSGTILLKDHVTLRIAENAILLSSPDKNDFAGVDHFVDATGQSRGHCLIGAMDVEDVGIIGKGVIEGLGHLYKNPIRPFMIRFVRTKDLVLKDISLRQPAAWTVHLFQCENFLVDGIRIYSHANKNNDGIDIDSSTDGVIRNCDIDSGDDAICFKSTSPLPSQNVEVYNCRLKSNWGAIKFGTESMGDFRNISVKNCNIHNTRGGGIKILSVDGANIENIVIDSIQMENVDMPLFMRLGERRRTYRDAPRQPVGSITNVSISNIRANTRSLEESRVVPPTGIFVTGTSDHKIGHVSLSNIAVTLPGGGTAEHVTIQVPENETKYPEFTKFDGPVPAYGLYARHIDDLQLSNISFNLLGDDEREEVVLEDVNF